MLSVCIFRYYSSSGFVILKQILCTSEHLFLCCCPAVSQLHTMTALMFASVKTNIVQTHYVPLTFLPAVHSSPHTWLTSLHADIDTVHSLLFSLNLVSLRRSKVRVYVLELVVTGRDWTQQDATTPRRGSINIRVWLCFSLSALCLGHRCMDLVVCASWRCDFMMTGRTLGLKQGDERCVLTKKQLPVSTCYIHTCICSHSIS